MYTNTKNMLKTARKNGYAIGAYNIYNLETIKAVITAGKESNTPMILQASESAIEYAGATNLVGLVKNEAENSAVEFALHLDHGKSVESVKTAIDAGFSSVMIDLSNLPFEENIKKTAEVVLYAHKKNVTVEAELGELVGVEDNQVSKTNHLTDPKKVLEFITKTNVDSLAVSIGTAHGINKSESNPQIHYEILEEIEKLIPKDFPLVCHGASTVTKELQNEFLASGGEIKKAQGIPLKDIHKMATTTPICKINMDTDLRLIFTTAVRKCLNENKSEFNPRKYLGEAEKQLTNQIKEISTKILN